MTGSAFLRWAAIGLAVVVVCLSLTINATYWLRVHAGNPVTQALLVVASVVCGVAKILIPAIVIRSGAAWSRNKMGLLAWCVALAFDVISGVGFFASVRDAADAIRAKEIAAHAARVSAATRARDTARVALDMASVPAPRAAAVIAADLAAARIVAGSCASVTEARGSRCVRLTELAQEEVRRVAAVEAAAALSAAADALAALGNPPVAERSDVASVHRLLVALGMPVTADGVALGLAVLLLLLFEVFPPAITSAALAPTLTPTPTPTPTRPGKAPVAGATLSPANPVVAILRSMPSGPHGWIKVSQRDLGKQMQTSATSAGRQISGLVASGQLERDTRQRGTVVRIATR